MMKFRFRRQGADPQREKLKQELFAFHKVRRRERRRLRRTTSGRLCPASAALLGCAWSGSQAAPRAVRFRAPLASLPLVSEPLLSLPGVPWAQWGPPTYLPFTLGLFSFIFGV